MVDLSPFSITTSIFFLGVELVLAGSSRRACLIENRDLESIECAPFLVELNHASGINATTLALSLQPDKQERRVLEVSTFWSRLARSTASISLTF